MKTLRPARFALCAALATCGVVLPTGVARADGGANDIQAPTETGLPSTAKNDAYPQVSCTGVNPAFISEVLQLANETRDSLTPVLKLGPAWRFPVHIVLTAPIAGPKTDGEGESVSVVLNGPTLRLEASLPSSAPNAHEFIQRQFVTALLWEKFFKPDTAFSTATRLDVVPLWLLEGLRETLDEDPSHNRDEIVQRAALAGRAPRCSKSPAGRTWPTTGC